MTRARRGANAKGSAAALAMAVALAAGCGLPTTVAAQVGVSQGIGAAGSEDAPAAGSNVSIAEVSIEVKGLSPADQRSARLRLAAEQALGISPGDLFNALIANEALSRIRKLEGVRGATYRFSRMPGSGGRALVVEIDAEEKAASQPGAAEPADARFPVLYQSDTTLLRVLLNGGAGAFNDFHPWFGNAATYTRGNPLVQDPSTGAGTGARAAWAENYVEYGLGGASRIGSSSFYVYGAGTAISVMSAGQDIFRDDPRATTTIEKLYGGILYVAEGGGPRVNVSAGRQNFTLNDGWLVSQFGSQWNAGPRPGVYLAPRTTHDLAALATAKWRGWTWTSFFLDPNETEQIESRTQLAGSNLRYTLTKSIYGDISYLHVPKSDTTYGTPSGGRLPREGLSTYAGHFRWADRDVIDGLWIETEAARQTHSDFSMNAWAGYGTVGYLARALPWTPSLSYRYAYFSGDDPSTPTFERFDTLYSGGLSEWLQGISGAKAMSQSNRETHRVRFNVTPSESLNLTLDYYRHFAVELNNIGASRALSTLQSRDLAQEVQLVARWAINKNLYFLGVAAHALPGEALQQATPDGDRPWSTLQAQLLWNF